MEYIPIRVSDLIRLVNKDLYLPAIQREFVWSHERVARLFDSIMSDFPIGSFLFWQVEQRNKDEWPIYEFIRDYDDESPHNAPASMVGVNKDVTLVLDGQQRITSLLIGLVGSYRYLYYRWKRTNLYLNLLKSPVPNEDNPEEPTYAFAFREDPTPQGTSAQLWYRVGRILEFEDAEDAKADMRSALDDLSEGDRDNANRLIGRLHNRIHTTLVGNYYLERSQDYDKVLQEFVRANSGGVPLEYSDLLLATATAKWKDLDARSEIHNFTDELNAVGPGYSFGKDFVLKASLYLTDDLPVQYRVKNFTRTNLWKIEENWDQIKTHLLATVKLMSRFGFSSKNIVAPLTLLPVAYFARVRGNRGFDLSSSETDARNQTLIRRWFILATLKNAFGASSDTLLTRVRELLAGRPSTDDFPAQDLYGALNIDPELSESEVERLLDSPYQGRYTYLVLTLLYPDRDYREAVFHEDHIYPQSAFQAKTLKREGVSEDEAAKYIAWYNRLPNLQLLMDSENIAKNATPFRDWLETREPAIRQRHLIPDLPDYQLSQFGEFFTARRALISQRLRDL